MDEKPQRHFDFTEIPVKKPYQIILLVLLVIFVVESGLMFLLPDLELRGWLLILVDSSLLALLSFPILYLLVLRPLQLHLAKVEERNNKLRLFYRIFEESQEAVIVTDPENRIEYVNPAFSRITGYTSAEVFGKNPSLLKSGRHDKFFYQEMWRELELKGSWSGEVWNRKRNGELYPEMLSIVVHRDLNGALHHYVGLFSDISRQKAEQSLIEHRATHDDLTGLLNRALFFDHLKEAQARAERSNLAFAIIYIDLDQFKAVNDHFGHDVGDQLLRDVARRMTGCVRKSDTVARLGGDEFAMIINDVKSKSELKALVEKIQEQLNIQMEARNLLVTSSASIGVAQYPADGQETHNLMKLADEYMYRAKQSGRNRYYGNF